MKGAGRLNNRVVIERKNENATPDAGGQVDWTLDSNWRIACHRWCEIVPKGSREFLRLYQVTDEITHGVKFRYDQESRKFKTSWRVKIGTRVLNIAGPGIDPDERHEYLIFPAIEVEA